jgi:hypothetical protein
LDADLIKKYREKIKEWHSYSNERRRLNRPKRGNLEHPDATWEFFQRGYEEYLDSTPFTNTEKGRQDLKAAALVGFYTIQRPRRVEDWFLLEYHTRLPVEADRESKNILHIEGETSTIYLDKFKTRWRTVNNKKKEVLPTYVNVLNPRLTSLLKDYIVKLGIKDNSKRTAADKRAGVTFYVFPKADDVTQPYAKANNLGDYLSTALFRIFKKRHLSANSIRHAFNTYLAEHIGEFTDSQLIEIANDLGDTMHDMPTNLRYRIAKDNEGMTKTEIFGALQDDEYARGVLIANAQGVDENASVGNGFTQAAAGGGDDEDDEVQSPPVRDPRAANTAPVTTAGSTAILLQRLAEIEAERTQLYMLLIGRVLDAIQSGRP